MAAWTLNEELEELAALHRIINAKDGDGTNGSEAAFETPQKTLYKSIIDEECGSRPIKHPVSITEAVDSLNCMDPGGCLASRPALLDDKPRRHHPYRHHSVASLPAASTSGWEANLSMDQVHSSGSLPEWSQLRPQSRASVSYQAHSVLLPGCTRVPRPCQSSSSVSGDTSLAAAPAVDDLLRLGEMRTAAPTPSSSRAAQPKEGGELNRKIALLSEFHEAQLEKRRRRQMETDGKLSLLLDGGNGTPPPHTRRTWTTDDIVSPAACRQNRSALHARRQALDDSTRSSRGGRSAPVILHTQAEEVENRTCDKKLIISGARQAPPPPRRGLRHHQVALSPWAKELQAVDAATVSTAQPKRKPNGLTSSDLLNHDSRRHHDIHSGALDTISDHGPSSMNTIANGSFGDRQATLQRGRKRSRSLPDMQAEMAKGLSHRGASEKIRRQKISERIEVLRSVIPKEFMWEHQRRHFGPTDSRVHVCTVVSAALEYIKTLEEYKAILRSRVLQNLRES